MCEAKAGIKGTGPYHGAIRVNGRVVWTCPHSHHNRDRGSYTRGQAAFECSREVLQVAVESDEQRQAMENYLTRTMVAPFEAERLGRALAERRFALSQADAVRNAIASAKCT